MVQRTISLLDNNVNEMIDIQEKAWAIARIKGNKGFLYYGTFPTRRDAINDHISKISGLYHVHGPMSKEFMKKWKECKRRGDRAVMVNLIALT